MQPLIAYADRPTDMLQRQMLANRQAARAWIVDGRGNRRRHFAHDSLYRRHFVIEMIAMRNELKRRNEVGR